MEFYNVSNVDERMIESKRLMYILYEIKDRHDLFIDILRATMTTTSTTTRNIKTQVDTERLQFHSSNNQNNFIGSIDQGTSSSRFIVFCEDGHPVVSAQVRMNVCMCIHRENENI